MTNIDREWLEALRFHTPRYLVYMARVEAAARERDRECVRYLRRHNDVLRALLENDDA